jgi:secreted PhoX family phosphatase
MTLKRKFTRRDFLFKAGTATLGLMSSRSLLSGKDSFSFWRQDIPESGYGPLAKDPEKIMDLPKGFSYKIIARSGERMTDGFFVPGHPDGMGTFEGPDGSTIVLRNHENFPEHPPEFGPFGPANELVGRLGGRLIYDRGREGRPALGAVTTLVYDTEAHKVRSQYLSLAGTLVNCSGGVTPWNSWLSCEEIFQNPSYNLAKKHGYVFEIPASADRKVIKPIALKAMGRFVHESIAVDPRTNILYQTEDQLDGLVYRFLPNRPGHLEEGGRLQCLGIDAQTRMDTRNWDEQRVKRGEKLSVSWIDLEDVDPRKDNLRHRGFELGAALFASGEGMDYFDGSVYFDCTNGGRIKAGQIWRYVPSPYEGTDREVESPGHVELMVDVTDRAVLENPDQMIGTPWGDVLVCEDGFGEQHLAGVTPKGEIYRFARNAKDESEFTGVCFSPDGSTMFVNYQDAGYTFAVTGSWKSKNGG